jgi:hypothetical protein
MIFRMCVFRMMLFAPCLVVTGWPQATNADWAVYGARNSKPEFGSVEIKQGDRLQFQIASTYLIVGSHEPRPYAKPLARVNWSIQPSKAGVSVSAEGTVIVSATAPPGKYKIVAQAGNQSRSRDFLVYVPQALPLKGEWTEKFEISCDGHEIAPTVAMGELVFSAGGDFSATWLPFETRKDYWGNYTYDVKTEKLFLRVDPRHNYSPPDISPEGRARVDDRGRLVITGMWLGTPPNQRMSKGGLSKGGAPKTFCGYVFERR